MIVSASSLRQTRRPRRTPSVAPAVRVPERPDAWTPRTVRRGARASYGTARGHAQHRTG